jgi:hypothetical protein
MDFSNRYIALLIRLPFAKHLAQKANLKLLSLVGIDLVVAEIYPHCLIGNPSLEAGLIYREEKNDNGERY